MTIHRPAPAIGAALAFLATIVAANWLTAHYGFVPIGFGLFATVGTYAAGLAFVARDAVQDTAGRRGVLTCLAIGVALSWLLSNPTLALASAVAFGVSELADTAVYTPLRRRGYIRAAVASNLVGSIVDTGLFLTLAGFGLNPTAVTGQLVGKAWATAAIVALVVIGRALLRNRVRTESA